MNANGYCDVAYHFLIDKYGQIFEGRKGGVIVNPRAVAHEPKPTARATPHRARARGGHGSP